MAKPLHASSDNSRLIVSQDDSLFETNNPLTGERVDFSEEDFKPEFNHKHSSDIGVNSQVTEIAKTMEHCSGSLKANTKASDLIRFLPFILWNSWVDLVYAIVDGNFTYTAKALVDAKITGSGLDNIDFTKLEIGSKLTISKDGTDVTNKGVYTISGFDGGIDKYISVAEDLVAGDSSGSDVDLKIKFISNSDKPVSMTFGREFTDVNQFFLFNNCVASSFVLSLEGGDFSNYTLDVLGRSLESKDSSFFSDISSSAIDKRLKSNASVGNIFKDGADYSGVPIANAEFKFERSLEPKHKLNDLSADTIFGGSLSSEAMLESYWINTSPIVADYLQDGNIKLGFELEYEGLNGEQRIIELNLLNSKITEGFPDASGRDTEIMVKSKFEGMEDKLSEKMVIVNDYAKV